MIMHLSELKETSVLPKFTHLWLWKRTRDVNGNEDYEGYRNHCYGYVCDRKIWLWGLERYFKKNAVSLNAHVAEKSRGLLLA